MASVLAPDGYTGTLSVRGTSLPVSFRMAAGEDGRVFFEVDPVDGAAYIQLAQTMGRPGEENEHLTLSARSADGKSVASDSVYVVGLGAGRGGNTVRLQAGVVAVSIPRERPAPRPCLQFWLRSFKSFRNSPIDSPLGTLVVSGLHNAESDDRLSGWLVVQAPEGGHPHDWRDRADSLLQHISKALALAHGGRLQVPIVEYASGDLTEATFYSGGAFKPEFAVQPFLNQDPFIQATVARFFAEGPLPEVLWTALGWMQSDTTFDEIRFLTAMTALETIIESELPEKRGTTLAKAMFKPIRAALEKVIDTVSGINDEARSTLKDRIAGINRKSFAEKIGALFAHYGIPQVDFEGDTIRRMVGLRNDIVHRGLVPSDIDAWPQIILAREMITRILLKELGFVGRYECFVGGRHVRRFPECEPAGDGEVGTSAE